METEGFYRPEPSPSSSTAAEHQDAQVDHLKSTRMDAAYKRVNGSGPEEEDQGTGVNLISDRVSKPDTRLLKSLGTNSAACVCSFCNDRFILRSKQISNTWNQSVFNATTGMEPVMAGIFQVVQQTKQRNAKLPQWFEQRGKKTADVTEKRTMCAVIIHLDKMARNYKCSLSYQIFGLPAYKIIFFHLCL